MNHVISFSYKRANFIFRVQVQEADKQQHSTTITLVVVSDDHYMILVAALLRSVEAHVPVGTKIDLWIVSDGVSAESKTKMAASVNQQVTTIHWKEIQEAIPQGFHLPKDLSSYPLNIYMRLFIPYFIPQEVEKVLYLDADMIVLHDLTRLWNTDISNYVVGAVLDPRLKTFDNHWGGIKNFKALGFKGTTPYFNTGMLLINTVKWRAVNATEQIVKVINDNKRYANYPDQYGMNIVLHNQWLRIDDRWNHFVTERDKTPYILHYVERKPIYNTYKNGEDFRLIFMKYLQMTAWRDTPLIKETSRYAKKLKNIWDKLK